MTFYISCLLSVFLYMPVFTHILYMPVLSVYTYLINNVDICIIIMYIGNYALSLSKILPRMQSLSEARLILSKTIGTYKCVCIYVCMYVCMYI